MFSRLYDKKYLFKCLLGFCITFGLMRVTGGAGFAIVIPMVFYSFLARKTESLFFWLLVAVCAIIINPHLVMKGGGFAWIQRGLMVSLGCMMALNVMSYKMHNAIRPYAGMIVYVVFMAFSSWQGWNPIISYLKLLLFSLIYFSYFGVVNQVGINPRVSSAKIRSIMLSVAVLFVLGSMALVPFPGLSQMNASDFEAGTVDLNSYTSLFMGMTNHSQCLGPIISVTSVVLMSDLLFSIKKADVLYIVMLLCCPYLVYLTSSRTGMGAFLVGQAFVIWVFMNARGVGSRWKSRVMSSAMMVATGMLILLTCIPSVQERMIKFITKSTRADDAISTEQIISTRKWLMVEAIHNFKKSPLFGNGFQVSSEMKQVKVRGLALLSAPIEKGVWVTAVLEEGGIIGWSIFVIFLVVCITKSIKRHAYIGASCLFVSTMTNLGEFSFFSMSYTGGFTWAMVFVGLALDLRKMNDENEAMRKEMMRREMEMMQAEGGIPFAG